MRKIFIVPLLLLCFCVTSVEASEEKCTYKLSNNCTLIINSDGGAWCDLEDRNGEPCPLKVTHTFSTSCGNNYATYKNNFSTQAEFFYDVSDKTTFKCPKIYTNTNTINVDDSSGTISGTCSASGSSRCYQGIVQSGDKPIVSVGSCEYDYSCKVKIEFYGHEAEANCANDRTDCECKNGNCYRYDKAVVSVANCKNGTGSFTYSNANLNGEGINKSLFTAFLKNGSNACKKFVKQETNKTTKQYNYILDSSDSRYTYDSNRDDLTNNQSSGDNPSTDDKPITPPDPYKGAEKCATGVTDEINYIVACGCIPANIADITSKVYYILRVIGPILLIIVGGIEMVKAVGTQDESAIEKAKKKLVNKAIAAAAIFLVFTLIKLGISIVRDQNQTIELYECLEHLLNGYKI